jgi:hypothetical protein
MFPFTPSSLTTPSNAPSNAQFLTASSGRECSLWLCASGKTLLNRGRPGAANEIGLGFSPLSAGHNIGHSGSFVPARTGVGAVMGTDMGSLVGGKRVPFGRSLESFGSDMTDTVASSNPANSQIGSNSSDVGVGTANRYITDEGTAHYFDTFINCLESSACPLVSKVVYLGVSPPAGFKGVVYNTEQLTVRRNLDRLLGSLSRLGVVVNTVGLANTASSENGSGTGPRLGSVSGVELWDYSLANVRLLAQRGVVSRHVPVRSPEWYLSKLRGFRSESAASGFRYDVGFSGSRSERRASVLDALSASGLNVLDIRGWGDDRDRLLASCRVHLNIHYSADYMVFESARCEPWLSIGVPVISELSIDNDARCILASYDGLVETVLGWFRENR